MYKIIIFFKQAVFHVCTSLCVIHINLNMPLAEKFVLSYNEISLTVSIHVHKDAAVNQLKLLCKVTGVACLELGYYGYE